MLYEELRFFFVVTVSVRHWGGLKAVGHFLSYLSLVFGAACS